MDVEFSVDINVKRFRGGLVFKAHRLCVSLDSRLESKKEQEEDSITGERLGSASTNFMRNAS